MKNEKGRSSRATASSRGTALATLAATLASFAACAGTPGRAIELEVRAVPIAPEGGTLARFTTLAGWDVTLTAAHVALGPVYAYAPSTASAWDVLTIPVARAHGGEDPFGARTVRADVVSQIDFDALGGEVSIGLGAGSFGAASDVTVVVDPPAAEIAGPLHAHHAWIEGSATRGVDTIAFEGGLDLGEGLDRVVEGIPLSREGTDAILDDGGALVVEVHAEAWVDEMQFDRLPAVASGPRVIDPGTQPAIAWRLGLRSPAAWSARWEP